MIFTKRKKVLVAVGAVVVLLPVIQTITYLLFADCSMTPTLGLRNLRDYGLLREVDFVVVESSTWSTLNEHEKQNLTEELKRYVDTIYHSRDEVPEDRITWEPVTAENRESYERYSRASHARAETLERWKREIDAGRRIAGFKKGIAIAWKREGAGLFWGRYTSSHWVSMTGAESRTDVYLWLLFGWVHLYTESHGMA